jgi:hypothetical protein
VEVSVRDTVVNRRQGAMVERWSASEGANVKSISMSAQDIYREVKEQREERDRHSHPQRDGKSEVNELDWLECQTDWLPPHNSVPIG